MKPKQNSPCGSRLYNFHWKIYNLYLCIHVEACECYLYYWQMSFNIKITFYYTLHKSKLYTHGRHRMHPTCVNVWEWTMSDTQCLVDAQLGLKEVVGDGLVAGEQVLMWQPNTWSIVLHTLPTMRLHPSCNHAVSVQLSLSSNDSFFWRGFRRQAVYSNRNFLIRKTGLSLSSDTVHRIHWSQ